jgi:hypothetical protein
MPTTRPRLTGLLAACGFVLVQVGCGDDGYSQSSPEAVIATAQRMVEQGDADRLTDLLYADTPRMRDVLDQFGQTLRHLQQLADSIQKAYPEEIATLKAEAEAAAARGEATGFLGRIAGAAGARGREAQLNAGGNRQQQFNLAIKSLFADPYAWLRDHSGRLTATPLSDDTAALLWDGKAVFPPVGLAMREDKGEWYVVLPTNLPGIAGAMPRTDDEFEIVGALFQVLDNMLIDLRKDVESGKARDLEELSRVAGEKAFLPAMLVFFAYSQAVDAREKDTAARSAPAGTE